MEVSSDSLYVVVSDMNTLYDYFLEGETESSTCKCISSKLRRMRYISEQIVLIKMAMAPSQGLCLHVRISCK